MTRPRSAIRAAHTTLLRQYLEAARLVRISAERNQITPDEHTLCAIDAAGHEQCEAAERAREAARAKG